VNYDDQDYIPERHQPRKKKKQRSEKAIYDPNLDNYSKRVFKLSKEESNLIISFLLTYLSLFFFNKDLKKVGVWRK